jgi:hypothetical protein
MHIESLLFYKPLVKKLGTMTDLMSGEGWKMKKVVNDLFESWGVHTLTLSGIQKVDLSGRITLSGQVWSVGWCGFYLCWGGYVEVRAGCGILSWAGFFLILGDKSVKSGPRVHTAASLLTVFMQVTQVHFFPLNFYASCIMLKKQKNCGNQKWFQKNVCIQRGMHTT